MVAATRGLPKLQDFHVPLEDLISLAIKEAVLRDKFKRKIKPTRTFWRHEHISSFQYYCCPECPHRSKAYDKFKAHAFKKHSKVNVFF